MSTTVDIQCFHWHLYNQLLKVEYAFNLETLILGWDLNFANFLSLEVVDHGSETNLQMNENID